MKRKKTAKKTINRENPTHLYLQLLDILQTELSGLKGGERFYTDRQICKLFKVSQPTARSALSILMKEGLIKRVPSRGTFVNSKGKTPVKKKTMRIGIISNLGWYFPHVMAVQGVENLARECGYCTVIIDWKNGVEEQEESIDRLPLLIEELKKRDVDGFIVISPVKRIDREMPECLRNLDIPAVLVNWNIVDAEVPMVLADYEEGAHKLVTHLIKQGYKSIAYIGGSSQRQAYIDRFNGYRKALQENGIEYNPGLVYYTNQPDSSEPKAAREIMEKILISQKHPEAVFAATDMMAMVAVNVIQDKGLRVPEDIAVVGFNNYPHGIVMRPKLTTITQPYYEMGINAMGLLKSIIEGQPPGVIRVMVSCKLIIRESCGSNRGSK